MLHKNRGNVVTVCSQLVVVSWPEWLDEFQHYASFWKASRSRKKGSISDPGSPAWATQSQKLPKSLCGYYADVMRNLIHQIRSQKPISSLLEIPKKVSYTILGPGSDSSQMLSVMPENQLFNPSFGVGEFPADVNCNGKCSVQPYIHIAPSWNKLQQKRNRRATIKPWFRGRRIPNPATIKSWKL